MNVTGPDGGCECWYRPDSHQQVQGCGMVGTFEVYEVYEDKADKFRLKADS